MCELNEHSWLCTKVQPNPTSTRTGSRQTLPVVPISSVLIDIRKTLIPLIIQNFLEKKPIPVYYDGMNIHDWLFVKDYGHTIEMVLHQGTIGEIYNIDNHDDKTNIDIVKLLVGYLRDDHNSGISESLITYVADRKGHDRRYAIDPEKIGYDLG